VSFRERLRWVVVPVWLVAPLACLGLLYLLLPFGGFDWYQYGTGIVLAVGVGTFFRLRYRYEVLERSKYRVVSVIERRRRSGLADPPS
jgi:hypothetical protein